MSYRADTIKDTLVLMVLQSNIWGIRMKQFTINNQNAEDFVFALN